jgi:hypothetical protein
MLTDLARQPASPCRPRPFRAANAYRHRLPTNRGGIAWVASSIERVSARPCAKSLHAQRLRTISHWAKVGAEGAPPRPSNGRQPCP